MENCIFCKIVAGDIPSPRLYEDEKMIVIRDIEPKAKLHYLCIPKEHFALLSEMTGYIPPWGVLTGVRPSKLMLRLIADMGEERAKEYFTQSLLVSEEKTTLAHTVAKAEE